MTSQTHECMKAFSHGSLSQIRSIVMAYELLVSQDLMDKLYKYQMGMLNKEVKKYRDLKIAEYGFLCWRHAILPSNGWKGGLDLSAFFSKNIWEDMT